MSYESKAIQHSGKQSREAETQLHVTQPKTKLKASNTTVAEPSFSLQQHIHTPTQRNSNQRTLNTLTCNSSRRNTRSSTIFELDYMKHTDMQLKVETPHNNTAKHVNQPQMQHMKHSHSIQKQHTKHSFATHFRLNTQHTLENKQHKHAQPSRL